MPSLHQHLQPTIFLNPLVILFVLGCVMMASSCDDETQTKPEPPKYDISPNNTLWDFSMKFMDGNTVKATLSARRARLYAERNESLVDTNVIAEFYSPYGNRVARLTADSARVDNRTNNMWAYKNVRVVGDSSRTTLETSVLMWDNSRRKLTSDKYVKISRPGELIEGGVGFESDEDLRNYRIYQVKGVKAP
ncbi:MAG: LPS export ABC transporter periplasmic protein LptC [Candidatus Kapabacteria bacterium]|nr:LPS export ABC transporter periplasmic protein LptC [Candidatus Kapabacteria bacterium]